MTPSNRPGIQGTSSNGRTVRDTAAAGVADAFLQPQSMVTPGALGALTMLATNALAPLFVIDHRWIGLILAFVFGLVAVVNSRSLVERGVYYVINSIIIFSVAAGTNQVGVAAANTAGRGQASGWLLQTMLPSAQAASALPVSFDAQPVERVQFFQPWFQSKAPPPQQASPQQPLTLNPSAKNWAVVTGTYKNRTAAEQEASKLKQALGDTQVMTAQQPKSGDWSVVLKNKLTLPQALSVQQDVQGKGSTKFDTYLLNLDQGIAIGKPQS